MLLRRLRSVSALAALVSVAVVAGCGKDSGTGLKHVGPPANLTILSGDQQQAAVGAELPSPLVIKVVDASGNPIQGQTVNFRVTAGGGSVFAGASTTNTDGIAQERWTLGTVAGQEQIVEARAVDNSSGQALVFATFHATAVAGPAKALAITAQPAATVKAAEVLSPQPNVQLVDQYGNAVKQSGVNVTAVVAPAAGHTLQGTATVATNAQGIAQFTDLRLKGTSGAVTLAFSAPSLTSVASNQFMLAAGAPATLEPLVATTLSATVGSDVSALPAIVVKDASGNGVPGVTVLFALSNGGGTITPASVKTDPSGHAALTRWTMPTAPGTAAVVASVSELSGASVTFTATVQPGTASQLVAVSGNGTAAGTGQTVTLVARANDLFGNPVAGVTVNWAAVGNSGTLSTPSSTTDAIGEARVSVTLPSTATTSQVIASLQGGASVTFSVSVVAPATQVASLIGTTTSSSVASIVTLPVRVSDAFDFPVAGVPVTCTIVSGGGSLNTVTAVTDAAGKAQVSYTLPTQAGTNQLKESIPSGANVIVTVQAIPLGPAGITKLSGDNVTTVAGTAISPSPVILVSDQYGNALPNVPVSFSVTAGGGSISGSSLETDNSGKATAGTWVLGTTPGSNTLTAKAGGVTVTFTATGTPGPAAKLLIIRQPSSFATSGIPLEVQPIVQITDQSGNALKQPGVTVTATTVAGITLSNASAVTDANGQATFSGLTATGPDGTFAIDFGATGLQGARSSSVFMGPTTRTWVGGAPGAESDWDRPLNWTPLGVPVPQDTVVIPVTSYKPRLVGQVRATSVLVAPGTELQLNGWSVLIACFGTASCAGQSNFSGTFAGPGSVLLQTQTPRLLGPTTVPDLGLDIFASLDVNGQPLTVTGNLDERSNARFAGYGSILVYGTTRLAGNEGEYPTQMGLLEAKGDVTVVCSGSPCRGVNWSPLRLSGTSHQTITVGDPHYEFWGDVTATAGSDVTFAANTSFYPLQVGALDLSGSFTIPAGVTVSATSVKLHSGSSTTVLGKLTFGSCSAEPGATYSGFSCP